MSKPRAWIAWSSGKDSACALHEVRRAGQYDVVGALTTLTERPGSASKQVSVHGVREVLLAAQLEAAGLAPIRVPIPSPCPNAVYERAMGAAMTQARADGVTHVIFGDLFLADIRAYREASIAGTGITPVFPLWDRPTDALAREMVACGIEATLVVADLKKLTPDFAGRRFDKALLDALPKGVDPCGENGEFHTFVSGGPMFARAIPVAVGETTTCNGFAYADLLPG